MSCEVLYPNMSTLSEFSSAVIKTEGKRIDELLKAIRRADMPEYGLSDGALPYIRIINNYTIASMLLMAAVPGNYA